MKGGHTMIERTLAIIKPDAVERGFIGNIISRIERKGFRIVKMKSMVFSRECAERFYEEHKGKPFYEGLINFMSGRQVIVMILERENAVKILRKLVGSTDPAEAAPGTIRGDIGLGLPANSIHASDSVHSASREISILFGEEEAKHT
jgi:nucleoside-diphosphate kinase